MEFSSRAGQNITFFVFTQLHSIIKVIRPVRNSLLEKHPNLPTINQKPRQNTPHRSLTLTMRGVFVDL